MNYAMATELNKESKAIQGAMLSPVTVEKPRDVFSTFKDWDEEGDAARIEPMLMKFPHYCQPCKNVPFERYHINSHTQEPGEMYGQYHKALRKLARGL